MNDALQALEVKVENGGATPQGKVFAKEWNVLVEAVKALDLKEFDEAALHKFLQDNGYITEDNIPTTDLSDVVTLATEQAISGRKNFVGGVEVNGQELVYDAEKKVWQLTGDLVVTGAVTMFGSLSGFTPSTVMDAVLVDGTTIVKNAQGQLTVIGGGGSGGSGGGLTAAEVNLLIANALSPVKENIATKWTQDNTKIANWDAAYNWGDHSAAGYAINTRKISTGTGLTGGGDLSADITISLDTVGTAGTYTKVTTDAYGRVKSGTTLAASDIPSLDWSKITSGKPTTISGYGITDAYTKEQINTELAKYILKDTAQEISAQHNFVNGLKIGGLGITKSQDDVIYVDANLVVRGAVTMFGSGATVAPSIWASIPFDDTMEWDGSKWSVVGGGSGSVNEATVNNLIYEYLTQNSYAKISDISSALTGYATQTWVEGKKYLTGITSSMVTTALGYTPYNSANFTKANIKTTLGISDWALAATKPSYTAAEVGALSTSGGSVSSDDYQPLIVNSNFSSGVEDVRIAISHNWNVKGLFNWESNGVGLRMYNTACGSAIGIKDDGTPYYDSYELIHSGNIGSYNAGSATKLATARTIWGQSFDGTKDISGLLTDVDGIRGSTTNGGYIGDRNKGLGATDGGSMIYNYSSSPITFHIAGFEYMRITNGGNVAIGGTTADYKLHVHGVGGFKDGLWAQGIRLENTDEINSYGSMGGTGNGPLYLNYRSNGHVILAKGGGYVGIGSTVAEAKLHVHGDAKINTSLTVATNVQVPANGDRITFNSVSGTYTKGVLAMNANNTYFEAPLSSDSKTASKPPIMIGWTDGTYPIYINPNTNVSIGGTSASAKLHVHGDILATGAITMFSQLSLKNVIDYDGLSLTQLAQIRPARFTWKDGRDNRIHVGGIADYIQPILPEVVYETVNKELTVDYGSAAYYIGTSLIKPVVELWEVKDKQQQEIESLKKRVEYLENGNRQLRAS